MFPVIEYIKTCLNGLRSRIETVEKSISQALASVKAQLADIIQDIKNVRKENAEAIKSSTADWGQNDSNALDYVKNRTHYMLPNTPIGSLEFTATNSDTIEYTMTEAEEENEIFSYFRNLSGKGEVLKVIVGGKEGLLAVAFDYGYFNFSGAFTGRVFSSSGNVLSLVVQNDFITFNQGDTYTASFEDTTKPYYVKLDVNYIPDNVYSSENAPVKFGAGENSTVQGSGTTATGSDAHAEGSDTVASGAGSHAEGVNTKADGGGSHAEGSNTEATADYSHAEGSYTEASGINSHAEGEHTVANRREMHSEGKYNLYDSAKYVDVVSSSRERIWSNMYAASEYTFDADTGYYTLVNAVLKSEAVIGLYYASSYQYKNGTITILKKPISLISGNNYKTEQHQSNLGTNTQGKYVHVVGNGDSSALSNAYTLDWDGNGWFAGDVFVGGTRQDEGVKLLKAGEAIPIPQTASVGQAIAVKAVDENGKPTEWAPATLPEQVQANWNQNDNTAADYVKNRPFYLKDARETRIFERVFTPQTGLKYENFDGTNLGLEAGKEYTVNIMGQEFKATAYVYEDGVVCIGDGDAAYNGTTNFRGDVPFGVMDVVGDGYAIVLSAPYLAESGLVSGPTDEIPVNIISEIQEVVPIDSKFLPKATQYSAGVISKNQVRNEIFVNESLNVYENETTYKQLREYLGNRVFSVIHCMTSNISSDGVSLFVTDYQTSIGGKGFVRVNGYSISGGNIKEIEFVFPLNSDGSGIDDGALLESISLIIPNYILLENNNKKFKITVDDSGTISATEVVS